ncbi:MAG: hypothetical protein IMX00_02885 [Limnochordales bacterium]|nr:hypothetical protein [Limnochordales bacterium]
MPDRLGSSDMGGLTAEIERVVQEYLGPAAAREVGELAPEERGEFLDYLQEELGIVLDEDQLDALTYKPRLRLEDVIAAFRQAGVEGEGEDVYSDEFDF